MKATLLTIGDELLIGQVIDTNSAWIAKQLNKEGISVLEILSISDTREAILEGLDRALNRSDIVLTTGGLGPTKDDITKQTIADYFGSKLVIEPSLLADLKSYMAKRGRPMLESVKTMALVPENCTTIRNQRGTAAAMWFEYKGKVVVSMPGVPHEMKDFMEREVLDRLKDYFYLPTIQHKTLLCAGLGEAIVAEKLKPVTDILPKEIKLAYLPNFGILRLRLSGSSDDKDDLQQKMDATVESIKQILAPKYLFGEGTEKLEEVIGKLLLERNATMSTAESCTGGLVAHKITSNAGSSAYYVGGGVTYSNQLKKDVLGVKEETLKEFGAVSEQTVIEMAKGANKNFGSQYSVAISGIAGPGGGSKEKPVGMVWMAVSGPNKTEAKKFQFARDRELNIKISATFALVLLRRMILEI